MESKGRVSDDLVAAGAVGGALKEKVIESVVAKVVHAQGHEHYLHARELLEEVDAADYVTANVVKRLEERCVLRAHVTSVRNLHGTLLTRAEVATVLRSKDHPTSIKMVKRDTIVLYKYKAVILSSG